MITMAQNKTDNSEGGKKNRSPVVKEEKLEKKTQVSDKIKIHSKTHANKM